jgi:hypothetical protein
VLPDLDLLALSQPLQDLTPSDRRIVYETINLIQRKQHAEALAKLIGLTASNPMNSALRIIRAYVLLELGNVAGALGDARIAEGSGGALHSAYQCWFLAQVAYLAGDTPLCRREIRHLAGDPSYGKKAEQLGDSLAAKSK